MPQKIYRIEEVAAKTGLTKRALRYYEDLALITPLRTESGYRAYSEEDVEKIGRIIAIKDGLGIRLNDLKEILVLEKNLASIFAEPAADITRVEEALRMTEQQIRLIEEKERSLARFAAKYQKAYADLQQLAAGLKEGNKQT